MAISTLLRCSGCQACSGHMSLEYWLVVQKLQGLLLHCPHGLVDANYKFPWIDVGSDGSTNDASIYHVSELKEDLESPNNMFNIPEEKSIPGDDVPISNFIVGDNAFGINKSQKHGAPRKNI